MPGTGLRAVIFDLDGTLLDTLPDIAHSINSVLSRHGLPAHPVAAYGPMVGSGIQLTVRQAVNGSDCSDSELAALVEEVSAVYASDPSSRTRFYDGMEEVLSTLGNRGVPMAVLSNKPDRLVQLIAQRLLVKWHFDRIAGHREGMPRKPDPGEALHIARTMGAEPEDTVFLGDSDIDVHTAKAGGMFAAGAAWGFRGADELKAAGADAILRVPRDILDLVGST